MAAGESGPYILGGHSFGGVLAFELARRLERRGERVERLVLIDSSISRRLAPLAWARVRLRQLLLACTRDEWRDVRARAARRVRVALGWERPNRAERIRARCVEAMLRYKPEPIAAPAILALCTRYEVIDRPENSTIGVTLPWAPLVGRLTIEEFDCTHAEIVQDPGWTSKVAEYLRTILRPEAIRARTSPVTTALLALSTGFGIDVFDSLAVAGFGF